MSLSVEQINKLESENEQLKKEKEINLQRANALNRELNQLQTCLQEIEEIVTRTDSHHPASVANMVSVIRHIIAECEV